MPVDALGVCERSTCDTCGVELTSASSDRDFADGMRLYLREREAALEITGKRNIKTAAIAESVNVILLVMAAVWVTQYPLCHENKVLGFVWM